MLCKTMRINMNLIAWLLQKLNSIIGKIYYSSVFTTTLFFENIFLQIFLFFMCPVTYIRCLIIAEKNLFFGVS